MNTPPPSSSAAVDRPLRCWVTWTILRRASLGLATFAVLLGLFYGFENWRGWRAWTAERQAVAAQETPLELADLVPPPVPDDQNLANTQPFLQLFDWSHDTNGHWINPHLASGQSWCDLGSIHGNSSFPGVGRWDAVGTGATNPRVDLALWQAYFRSPVRYANKLVAEARQKRGLPVPEPLPTGSKARPTQGPPGYPLPEIPGRPAEDILLALKLFDQELATISEGSRRPYARFPIRYEDGPSALLPHLASIKRLTTVLALRSVARLEAGQTDGAIEDLHTALLLTEALAGEPLLISQLVRYASLQFALQPVWEGQIQHRWSAAQLETIQGWLGKTDVQPGMRRALAGERVMVTGIVQTILASSQGRREMAGMFEAFSTYPGPTEAIVGWPSFYLACAPRGWLYASTAEISRALRTLETATPAELLPLASAWPPPPPSDSYRFKFYRAYLRLDLEGGIVHSALKALRAQAHLHLAQTACALERYRLDQGQYPDRLQALVPQWLDAIPVDPMDQKPLRYARDGDERFRLWSLAENCQDEGGAGTRPVKGLPLGSPDWVWAWPSP